MHGVFHCRPWFHLLLQHQKLMDHRRRSDRQSLKRHGDLHFASSGDRSVQNEERRRSQQEYGQDLGLLRSLQNNLFYSQGNHHLIQEQPLQFIATGVSQFILDGILNGQVYFYSKTPAIQEAKLGEKKTE
jgi:hypothetical protein